MRKNQIKILAAVLVLLSVLLSCNLPSDEKSVDDIFPETPNATMTALFAQATVLTPDFADVKEFSPTIVVIENTATDTVEPTVTLTETPAPTETPQITNTNTPPPTLTANPMKRSSGYFVASYLNSPPVIDGDWADWSTIEYPAGSVVFGAANWENDDDLESAFRIGWDYTYLYIAVKVKDDVYVQNATGTEFWKGDSIEILLDTNLYDDFYYSSLSVDDYQLGISPGNPDTNGTKEAYLWYPYGIAGPRTQVSVASIGGSGVYRVEAAIPWTVFGVSPSMNRHFGFAISVSDNDTVGTTEQQSMVSSTSTRRLTNPTTWSELVLGN